MNAPRRPTVRKFNPGLLQSDRDIIAQFAVRRAEFRTVLRVVRENLDSPSCQHVLIVGPRGRGKTMLLARLAAELRTDPALSPRALPVQFMEESLEVFSLADFWLEALFHLARELAAARPEIAAELRATHDDLKSRWRERELADRARAAVIGAAELLDRHLVLMVENLQALADSVDEHFGWGLRHALQTEPRLTLIATATSRFDALEDTQHAFYELFRTVCLGPLGIDSCLRLWQAVGGGERSDIEIEPIRILTGGSPRLLVIIARFARRLSLRDLMEELVVLIDDHTEYFRGHLEGMPRTERRVYLALIDLWRPSATGEIAERAALDVRHVSTMLGRLAARGAVLVEGAGKKRLYSAAERLYCIYYKLRRGRGEADVVHHLIRFMRAAFAETEQRKVFTALLTESPKDSAVIEGVRLAVAEDPGFADLVPNELIAGGASAPRAGVHEGYESLVDRIAAAFHEEKFERVVELTDRIMAPQGDHPLSMTTASIAKAIVLRGQAFEGLTNYPAAIAACTEAIRRFADHPAQELRKEIAKAYVTKGFSEHVSGKVAEALATWRDAARQYGADTAPALRLAAAIALFNTGIALRKTGDTKAAISAWSDPIIRLDANVDAEGRRILMHALFSKGLAQYELGDLQGAIATWKPIAADSSVEDSPPLRQIVVLARSGMVAALLRTGSWEAALAAWNGAEDSGRYGDMVVSLARIAEVLSVAGSSDEASKAAETALRECDKILHRLESDKGPMRAARRKLLANMLNVKAVIHRGIGDIETTINVCDEIIRRFGSSAEPVFREATIRAMGAKAQAMESSRQFDEAIRTWDEAAEYASSGDMPADREAAAAAAVNKAIMEHKFDRHENAIRTCDEVVSRLGADAAAERRALVAKALSIKAAALQRLGQNKDAAMLGDEVDRLFGAERGDVFQEQVAAALLTKANAQSGAGDPEAAIAVCEEIVERFGAIDNSAIRKRVANALLAMAWRQAKIGHADAALRTCDDVESRLGRLAEGGQAVGRRFAIWTRMKALLVQEKRAAAMDAYRSALAAYNLDDDAELREFLSFTTEAIAGGTRASDLLDALDTRGEISVRLAPLLVALRRRTGETVRAPAEIVEVADRVDRMIEERERAARAP